MKQKGVKGLALMLAVLMTAFLMPQSASAEEVEETVIAVDSLTEELDITFPTDVENVSKEQQTEKESAMQTTGDETALQFEDGVQTFSTETGSKVYYGTLSDYLSQSGDYKLYSISLAAGDYLQAKMSQPGDSSIDYDLGLYDSELNVLKGSGYYPYLNGNAPLEESVGYLATTDQKIYVGIVSNVGGSDTIPFTLEFTKTTNFSGENEPNENAMEAIPLDLGTNGVTVRGRINSVLDNDWYICTVPSDYEDKEIKLALLYSKTSTNNCEFEIYKNIGTGCYAMQYLGHGNGGSVKLPAGTYYFRIVSLNTSSNFDENNILSYTFTIAPDRRVDGIEITMYKGYHAAADVDYPEGRYYRVDDQSPNPVTVVGFAYNLDSMGNKYTIPNAIVKVEATNLDLKDSGKPELATTSGYAVTGDNGFFRAVVYMNPARGLRSYSAPVSTHYYDLVEVNAGLFDSDLLDKKQVLGKSHFYILDYCVLR